MAEKVRQALPSWLLELVLSASQLATEMGFSLYLVGGFVRDLLLEKPALDLDIVVEGDAIALAKRLSQLVGGRVHSHYRFGTAKLIFDGEDNSVPFVDFTTARREFYEYSTALPQVERSSIKQDLYRRDFTINTMAVSLDEDTFGDLLDFYGGERDLREGLIRVLHNLSFIEDPIRMLRAVRLEQRLGFRLEEMTEELISDALEWLDRVSGERIRQELDAVFQEDDPVRPLRRLSELGVLRQISPLLEWDDWLDQRVAHYQAALADWHSLAPDGPRGPDSRGPALGMGYLAMVSTRAPEDDIRALAVRLKLPKDEARFLLEAKRLSSLLPSLADTGLARSSVYHLLSPYGDAVIFLCWLATDDGLVKKRLELYHSELSSVISMIDGDQLRKMGLPPGPLYTEILGALRDARLDGKVSTLEDEKEEVQRWIAGAGND
jgi:tRNA nucleotidyltransferase (CCA-adding enzyme)